MNKIIRIYAAFFAVTITALYIAITTYHIDTLPLDFIISIADSRQGVPFITFVGALILELLMELIREALSRIPKQIGSGVGIVGGIVIGQAAVSAKVFSPLLLIVVAVSLLASFTAPDYSIMSSLKIIKFFIIFLSGMFGLIGFTVGFTVFLINVISSNSFGVPYLTPFAPFNGSDFKHTFLYGKDIVPLRGKFLQTKDKIRSKRDNKIK
jgi:spore germination protein KA/spore germination protein